jgi:hypothetical protein
MSTSSHIAVRLHADRPRRIGSEPHEPEWVREAERFPDVVAYPEQGVAWVATRHPERPMGEGADTGIIARFELPPE